MEASYGLVVSLGTVLGTIVSTVASALVRKQGQVHRY